MKGRFRSLVRRAIVSQIFIAAVMMVVSRAPAGRYSAFDSWVHDAWAAPAREAKAKKNPAKASVASSKPMKSAAAKSAASQPKHDPSRVAFNKAREPYHTLLQKDPHVEQLDSWEEAAAPLVSYTSEYTQTLESPLALFLLGKLYERTYREAGYALGVKKSIHYFKRLVLDFPTSEVADDALLVLGEMQHLLGEQPASEASYHQILDQYPNGDQVERARARLMATESQEDSAGVDSKFDDSETDSSDKGAQLQLAASEETSAPIRPAMPLALPSKKSGPMIVIDPGHGGEDLGALGVDGLQEKAVVLQVALFLEEMLRQELGAEVVLTRRDDEFIPLPDRTKIANNSRADLFISIHANSSEVATAKGIEIYYLDNTEDKYSLELAKRENKTLLEEGNDLGFMLSDLIQAGKQSESISLAHYVSNSMTKTLAEYYDGVSNRGVRKGPFFVLVGAHMPCVLVEVAFIDNPIEGRRLGERKYQRALAKSLLAGVRMFIEKKRSGGVLASNATTAH